MCGCAERKERDRQTERERERARETDRETERKRERQRERQRERGREREQFKKHETSVIELEENWPKHRECLTPKLIYQCKNGHGTDS